MIELHYKSKIVKAEHWDKLSKDEFIELFRRINTAWYDVEGRLELFKWIEQNQNTPVFIIEKLKIKTGKFPWRTVVLGGPKNGLRNITMGQFLFAEIYYFAHLRDQITETLNRFIAALYVEKNQPFDETLINTRAKLLENVIFETRQAIMFNYGAVRRNMIQNFKYLFPKANTGTQKAKKKQPVKIPEWEKWMWKLAGGHTDEDFDKIARSLARNVLKQIDTLIYESTQK